MSGYQEYHCDKCGLDWGMILGLDGVDYNCPNCNTPTNISAKDSSILRIRELCDEAIDHGLSWNAFCHKLLARVKTETAFIDPSTSRADVGNYSKDKNKAALELVDAAYDLVELYKPESPYNKLWRDSWLKKSKELGITPSW